MIVIDYLPFFKMIQTSISRIPDSHDFRRRWGAHNDRSIQTWDESQVICSRSSIIMKRKKIYLLIESALCALAAGLLSAAAIRMYVHGAAIQASGDLFYYIYTREKVVTALEAILPLITALIAFTVAGWVLGIRDEAADKPAALNGMDLKQSTARAVPQKAGRREHIIRIIILILAVVLIFLGVRNGGLEDVLAKGASICTECVGLG